MNPVHPHAGALLSAIEPSLPPLLVSPDALRRLRRLASSIPARVSWGVLECRLAEADERVDLSLCVRRGERELTAALLDEGPARPLHAATRALLSAWLRSTHEPWSRIPQLWLEFDLPEDTPAHPIAFVHFGMSEARFESPEQAVEAYLAVARAAVEGLGDAFERASLATLARCVGALPEGGRLVSMASLAPRGLSALRLDASVPRIALRRFLADCAWPGSVSDLERLDALCGPQLGRVNVELDLVPELAKSLGLLHHPPAAPAESTSWRQMGERLESVPSVAATKYRAAVEFIGSGPLSVEGAAWSLDLNRQLGLKVAVTLGGALEVKAYLAFRPSFRLF